MKLRFAAFAAITLAATLLVVSCNKGASNSNGANSNGANSNGNKETSASPTATAGSQSATPATVTVSASTPTEAFRSYYEAIKRKDVAAVKSLFSKATLAALEKNAAQKNTSFEEIFKQGLESASKEIPENVPETRNEKIDGNKATLEIKDEKKETWDTLRFVNEDGQWKIAFADADVN